MNERHYDALRDAVLDAHLAAWDGCHKIYLAMDEGQAAWFRAEYEHIAEGPADDILATVVGWWDESCALRFVSACTTAGDNVVEFTSVIPQCDADEDEDDYDDLEDDDDDELVSL